MDNYTYEARLFAAHGMAAMIFDKSGNGQSKGSGNFQLQSFEEKNDQYKALFRFLQNHPSVDSKKVGVHGPSEGGRLAMMMAIDLQNDIAFVNATAGPFMTFREGQFYAMDQHHRIMGVSEYDNMKIQQIWSDYYDGIVDGQIDQSVIDRANAYRQQNPRLFLPPDFTELPASPHQDDINNERVVLEAGKITCPILLQYGENDQRVNAQKSIANILPQISNPDQVETIIYKRGNHSFMTPEYKICPGYTSDKISWLKRIGI
jgi:dienelactone hydrolase